MRFESPTRSVAELEADGVLLVQDGNHGEYRPRRSEIVEIGTAHIRAADISDDGSIDFDRAQKINDVALARIRKGVGAPGDSLLTHKGTVGRIARVPMNAPPFVCSPQTTFWRSREPNVLDPDFLYAFLRSPAFAAQLRVRMHESDMAPYVSLTAQRSFLVMVPPIAEQRRIASILGALDEKIESNRRRSGVHAEMINVMFSHYVLERDEPTDGSGNLTSIARFVNGGAFTKGATGTGRPVLRIKELNTGISQATVFNDLDVKDENIARHHDLLFSWSGSLDVYRWHGPEALINQHIFKVLPLDAFPVWFVEGWTRHHLREFQGVAKEKATTMGHIKREHLKRAAVRIPPAEVIERLDAVLGPLDAQMGALARETMTLRSARDHLLPKLVTGKIRASASESSPATLLAPIESNGAA